MQTFIDAHPFMFTILAFPVVVTLCQCDSMKLGELRDVGRALATYQPAAHATTKAEADLWAKFYSLVG